jgi:transposase
VSIEQLLEKLNELEAKIKFLESQLAASNARVAELEAKLAAKDKDSNNSSNPPSKDPPGTQRKYPKRKKTDKKPGGQKGHQGKSKNFEKEPDIVQTHEATSCLECGESLEGVEGKVVERRQEIDIPPIEPIITEHQLIEKTCPCCKHRSRGSFPDHIRSLIQFGLNTIIAVIYFNVVHHIPFQRTTKIFKDMFHMSISEGTVENILNLAETKAIKYYDQIKEQMGG